MIWLVINAVTFAPLNTLSLDSAINVFFKWCMDAKIGGKMFPKKPKTTVTVTTILNWFQGLFCLYWIYVGWALRQYGKILLKFEMVFWYYQLSW